MSACAQGVLVPRPVSDALFSRIAAECPAAADAPAAAAAAELRAARQAVRMQATRAARVCGDAGAASAAMCCGGGADTAAARAAAAAAEARVVSAEAEVGRLAKTEPADAGGEDDGGAPVASLQRMLRSLQARRAAPRR